MSDSNMASRRTAAEYGRTRRTGHQHERSLDARRLLPRRQSRRPTAAFRMLSSVDLPPSPSSPTTPYQPCPSESLGCHEELVLTSFPSRQLALPNPPGYAPLTTQTITAKVRSPLHAQRSPLNSSCSGFCREKERRSPLPPMPARDNKQRSERAWIGVTS